jgi:hypothetical protein
VAVDCALITHMAFVNKHEVGGGGPDHICIHSDCNSLCGAHTPQQRCWILPAYCFDTIDFLPYICSALCISLISIV